MARLLLPILALVAAYLAVRAFSRLPGDRRAALGKKLLWAAGGALILLALSGRIHWLMAALPPAAVLLRWAGKVLVALPWFARLLSLLRAGRTAAGAPPHGVWGEPQDPWRRSRTAGRASPGAGRSPRRTSSRMTREQALSILGLDDGATRSEILAAHKRLIQKVHPDTGGTDYLAAEINQARDVLLQ